MTSPFLTDSEVWPGDLPAIPTNSKSRRGHTMLWVSALLLLAIGFTAGTLATPASTVRCITKIAEL